MSAKEMRIDGGQVFSQGVDYSRIAVFLGVIAIVSMQISRVLGGIIFIDVFALLLIPAFIFFLMDLLRIWPKESWDYKIAFVLVWVYLGITFFSRSHLEVALVDDNYHLAQTIAQSYRNSFYTPLQYIYPDGRLDERLFYCSFIESLWGVFYRWIRWDFIIVLLQGLPLVFLWKRVAHLLQCEGVSKAPYILSWIVILSLQVFWCQQGNGYNDSTAGIISGLALVELFVLLKHRGGQNLWMCILLLVSCASLTMISRLHLLPLGIICLSAALIYAFKYLNRKQLLVIMAIALIGLAYIISYYCFILGIKNESFMPKELNSLGTLKARSDIFTGWMGGYYLSHPAYLILKDLGFRQGIFYVVPSWLIDYKFRPFITPDPFIGGRGVIWTYLVIPVLLLALIKNIKAGQFVKKLIQPVGIILVIYILYYLFDPACIVSRFMLGFELFLLAWCMAWAAKTVEHSPSSKMKLLYYPVIILMLCVVSKNFSQAISGCSMRDKKLSVLAEQYRIFPHFVNPWNMR